MEQILLNGISAEELIEKISSKFATAIKNLNLQNQGSKEYISRKEAATLLKISLPTLNDWTKRGIVFSYRIGSRILYKPDEINDALDKREFKKFGEKGGSNA